MSAFTPRGSGLSVSFDERAILVGGRRELLISGEIHYPRVPEAEWERVLATAKDAGLNCVATYVFWNLHEERKGRYDFSGGKDLSRFLSLCGALGLRAILRAGPYCCAEWNYGGLPFWLRDEPGLELRTWNEPYLRHTGRYLRHLFAEIQSSLATQGGPVVVVQLENEYANIAKRYKQHGDRYLAWILELGREQGIDVPVVMCEGGANGALEAFNGFSISDDRVSDFRKRRAGQPLMWTELWPGCTTPGVASIMSVTRATLPITSCDSWRPAERHGTTTCGTEGRTSAAAACISR